MKEETVVDCNRHMRPREPRIENTISTEWKYKSHTEKYKIQNLKMSDEGDSVWLQQARESAWAEATHSLPRNSLPPKIFP